MIQLIGSVSTMAEISAQAEEEAKSTSSGGKVTLYSNY